MESEEVIYDIEKLKSGSQVILLRHAQTVFNKASQALEDIPSSTEEDEKILKTSKELRDSTLSPDGISQCEKAQPAANLLNIHTIFVSPYRRALQTVHNIFKDHPAINDIRVVVLPCLREFLNCTHDVPVNIDDVISEYKDFFPNFDTSAFDEFEDRLHYFLEDLDEDKREYILEKKEEKEDDPLKSNVFDIIMEMFLDTFPVANESVRSIYNRGQKARQVVQELLDSGVVEPDQKVIV
mmetsp:Transcript_39405/g.38955  ORF Transcript_39405/g.38955 Transcript_39405/m.38955 type:complete len:239 (+) Transcript_39405:20-736(+)